MARGKGWGRCVGRCVAAWRVARLDLLRLKVGDHRHGGQHFVEAVLVLLVVLCDERSEAEAVQSVQRRRRLALDSRSAGAAATRPQARGVRHAARHGLGESGRNSAAGSSTGGGGAPVVEQGQLAKGVARPVLLDGLVARRLDEGLELAGSHDVEVITRVPLLDHDRACFKLLGLHRIDDHVEKRRLRGAASGIAWRVSRAWWRRSRRGRRCCRAPRAPQREGCS